MAKCRGYSNGCTCKICSEARRDINEAVRSSSWQYQDKNSDADVKVIARDNGNTEFLVIDKSDGPHNHGTIDQDGNITTYHDYDRS
jgi:hypothetical protein